MYSGVWRGWAQKDDSKKGAGLSNYNIPFIKDIVQLQKKRGVKSGIN
jgi:hypothetical protein